MTRRGGFCWDSRSLLWAVLILAVSAAFSRLIAWPRMVHARELAAMVRSERAELATRYQSLEVIARAEKEAAALTARAANFSERVPAESMLGGFLEELARVAQKRNLHSDTIQPGEPIRLGDVVALPIAIKTRGPFSGVHGLLQDLERMPRLTRFELIKVVADEQHPGVVTAELNLRIFFLPPHSEAKTG